MTEPTDVKPDASTDKYHLVLAPDFELFTFSDKTELVAKLKERREEERFVPNSTRAIILKGSRVHISKGELKYVLFPDGDKLPLFTEQSVIQPDEDGYLVDAPAPDTAVIPATDAVKVVEGYDLRDLDDPDFD